MFKKILLISCILTVVGYCAGSELDTTHANSNTGNSDTITTTTTTTMSPDPTIAQPHYRSIFDAAKAGDINAVKEFIKHGVDPNASACGYTVLYFAASKGNFDVVRYLLEEKGVDPKDGLFFAAESGNLDLVKYFVEKKGLDPKAADLYGCTVLHNAAWTGKLDVVKYLVAKGADPKAADLYGCTVLHNAAMSGELDVVKYLVAKGADPKATDLYRNTVFPNLAGSGNPDVEVYLADHGAPVHPNHQERIAQHRAMRKKEASEQIKNSVLREQLLRGVDKGTHTPSKARMNYDVWQHIYSFIVPSGLTRDQFIAGGYVTPHEVDRWDNMTDMKRKIIKQRVQSTLGGQYLIQRLEHHRKNNAATNIQRFVRGYQAREKLMLHKNKAESNNTNDQELTSAVGEVNAPRTAG